MIRRSEALGLAARRAYLRSARQQADLGGRSWNDLAGHHGRRITREGLLALAVSIAAIVGLGLAGWIF